MISKNSQNDFLSEEGDLVIRFQRSVEHIPLQTILYMESSLRKVIIYSTQGTYQCYRKLDDIACVLDGMGFVRCHQSYMISLDKLTAYTNAYVCIGNTKIPISRRYQQTFLQQKVQPLQKNYGSLVCIQGSYLGTQIYFCPEKEILVGRDGETADLIVNLPLVSRNHCSIRYCLTEKQYEITDFSSNGTFVQDNRRLLPYEKYILPPGCELCFGDKGTVYRLG